MKKLNKIVSLTFLLMILSGCSKYNEIMTANEFKVNMEEKGFTVLDQTDTASDRTYQQIYVAVDEEKYSFEYYFMRDENSAKKIYQYAVSNLEATYASDSNAKIEHDSDDFNYRVSASDYYCVVIQRENTVLYVTAYANSEDDAKKIIKDLGY